VPADTDGRAHALVAEALASRTVTVDRPDDAP
jgi:hypothetical protein